jgi:2-methylisocitrate lyase-like PEP mutase family enzyme
MKRKTTLLKEYIGDENGLVMPGAYDSLSARIIEKIGFKAVAVGGFSLTATILGKPDVSLLTMTEMVNHVRNMVDAVDIPVFADAETGYGNIINVRRTVRELERAGVAGLFIEDQAFPAKCGLMEGIEVIPTEEMVAKIMAAVDTRVDGDMVVMARTDAYKVYGLDEAINRANRYREAGADLIFVVTPNRMEDLQRVAREVHAPKMAVVGEDGTSVLTVKDLAEIGFNVVSFPLSAIFSAAKGVWQTMQALYETGSTAGRLNNMIYFQEFIKLVGLEEIIRLQNHYYVKSRREK